MTTTPPRSRDEWADATVDARRLARFKFARQRIRRIADGEPRFTPEQLAELAAELTGAAA